MRQKSWLVTFAAVSVAAVTIVACSDQGVTEVASFASPKRPSFALVASGDKVCSGADGANMVVTPQHGSWANPIAGSVWVGKDALSSTDHPQLSVDAYTSSFTVPAGSINIKIDGNVLVDNDVVISGGSGTILATRGGPPYNYTPGAPEVATLPNFQTVGGLPFSQNSGFVAGPAANTVTFTVYNDDDSNAAGNPNGLSFCYTVTYTPAPPAADRGCSPGYWKNHKFPAGYAKTQLFNSNIPENPDFANAFPGKSFQTVLSTGGGGLTALGRHTVSAYFNAVVFGAAAYGLSPQQVVDQFNTAFTTGGSAIGTLSDLFESMEDVNGRTCGNPTGK